MNTPRLTHIQAHSDLQFLGQYPILEPLLNFVCGHSLSLPLARPRPWSLPPVVQGLNHVSRTTHTATKPPSHVGGMLSDMSILSVEHGLHIDVVSNLQVQFDHSYHRRQQELHIICYMKPDACVH
jgi:hypothetical protein